MIHKNIIPSERHKIFNWEVADATALAALTPVLDDVGKVALQLSPFAVYVLETHDDGFGSPIWLSITTPAIAAATVSVVDTAGYYTDVNVEDILQEIGLRLQEAEDAILLDQEALVWAIAFADETSNMSTGVAKATFHAPFDAEILEAFVGLTEAQPSGAILTIDLNINGASILSTKITVDNTELTSLTATTPPAFSSTAVVKGDRFSVDIDQRGDPGSKGGKMYIRVKRVP